MRHLVIMVKEPRPGRVKTRLAREIGNVPAAWWFRHQSARLIRRLARDPRWQTWLAVSPDTAMWSRVWPAELRRLPQGAGDLGDRMGRVMRSLPPGPVLVIGADIPGITPAHIEEAFRALSADAVFGPALDGGYWLVGLKRVRIPATLFRGVRWSSPSALADSKASLGGGFSVSEVAELHDVDTLADLQALGLPIWR